MQIREKKDELSVKFDGNIFSYTGNNKTFLLKSLAEYWASNSHNPVKLLVVHLKEKKKEIEVESEKHKMPQFISPEFLKKRAQI